MKKIISCCLAACLFAPAVLHAEESTVLPPAPQQIVTLPSLQFEPASLSGENFMAADVIVQQMSGKVHRNSSVLIASMVQLNDLGHTSALGRLVMQQISSRISQYGYNVLESRIKKDFSIIPKKGEFILSRDVSQLMQKEYSAQVVLVGSYVPTPHKVYVSIRLLRVADGVVVAAHEYTLKNRREFSVLLQEEEGERLDMWAMFNKRPDAFSKKEKKSVAPAVKEFTAPASSFGEAELRNFPALTPPAVE